MSDDGHQQSDLDYTTGPILVGGKAQYIEEIFRKNVAWAKMMLTKKKLREYADWFKENGYPADPTPIEQAAIEMLGL